jgi:hypothetical protein
MVVRPSDKMLKYFIEDEKKAVKEYKKYGYFNLARDELKHKKFLEKTLRMRGKK